MRSGLRHCEAYMSLKDAAHGHADDSAGRGGKLLIRAGRTMTTWAAIVVLGGCHPCGRPEYRAGVGALAIDHHGTREDQPPNASVQPSIRVTFIHRIRLWRWHVTVDEPPTRRALLMLPAPLVAGGASRLIYREHLGHQ